MNTLLESQPLKKLSIISFDICLSVWNLNLVSCIYYHLQITTKITTLISLLYTYNQSCRQLRGYLHEVLSLQSISNSGFAHLEQGILDTGIVVLRT